MTNEDYKRLVDDNGPEYPSPWNWRFYLVGAIVFGFVYMLVNYGTT